MRASTFFMRRATSMSTEVENKQLSLWDLGLLELYGKNNT